MTKQECEEVLQSMGYRKVDDSSNYAKPVGFSVFIVNFKVGDWSNWFMPYNVAPEDKRSPLLRESKSIDMRWTKEQWLNHLKGNEVRSKIFNNPSDFQFLTRKEYFDNLL